MKPHPTSAPMTLARQTFDGLGRQLTVEVAARTTRYQYQAGQLPSCANVLPDGKRIAYLYEPQLDNQIRSILPDGEAANVFTYDPRLGLPASISGPLGVQRMAYTASGQPQTDTWIIGDQEHVTSWRYALSGLLLGFDDPEGVRHARQYDRFGRLQQVKVGDVTLDIAFDEFDRPKSFTTCDPVSNNRLLQTLTYDTLGRENSRTFDICLDNSHRTIVQTFGYCARDLLTSRQWRDGSQVGEETFAYDILGRLTRYRANATAAPADPFGNRVIEQVFEFNALDGYTSVTSTFADGSKDATTFNYADNDPTQISYITHTHACWPARIDLAYDACGRVINYRFCATSNRPALDRTLTWDVQDRLVKVDDKIHSCDYRYDPRGELTDRVLDGVLSRSFFSGSQPTHEQTLDQTLRLMGDGNALFAHSRLAAGVHQATLLGNDAQGSVRIEVDSAVRTRFYTPHGSETANDENGAYGFAGERRDAFTGWYIPSGYRPYDPIIMGFLAPDSESPFGHGGLNPYAYCAGDPINRIDPSGHGWVTWLVAGVGLALGVVGAIASFGTAAPALAILFAGGVVGPTGAMAITAATMSAVSLGTGIASTVLEATDKDNKAASILGWVSFGTGLVGSALELAPKAAISLGLKTGRSAGRAARKVAKGPAFSKPSATGPVNYQKSSLVTNIYESQPGYGDVRFHSNYLNSGYPAFETHGRPLDISSELWNSKGVFRPAEEVALEMESWLRTIGHPEGEPFILLACNGGSSGAATKVATVTKRPVISFKKTIWVETDTHSQLLRNTPKTTNFPMAMRSVKKLFTQRPPYSRHFFLEAAEMGIYSPR